MLSTILQFLGLGQEKQTWCDAMG